MSLQKYNKLIDGVTELSEMSKTNYKTRLRRLTEITEKEVNWIIVNPEKVWPMIKATTESADTAKAYTTSIMALFKYDPTLKIMYGTSYDKWFDLFKQLNAVIEERLNKLEPTKRQAEAYMPWKEIIKGRNDYKDDNPKNVNTQAYVIVCIMTMIPPCRADLNKVRIYRDHKPTEEEKLKDPNYLLIDTTTTPNKMVLMYHEFKTACAERPFYRKELPLKLVEVITTFLSDQKKPKEYLITGPRTGKPYDNSKIYTEYFKDQTKKIYGHPMSVNVFRHSYIIYFCKKHPSYAKRQQLAIDMMNSVQSLERYQYEPKYIANKK